MNFLDKFKNYSVVTVIALIFGILIALQIKTSNASLGDSRDLTELQNNIKSYAEKNVELNERNKALYEEIEKLREAQLEGDISYQDILLEKDKFETFAGLTRVQNSGISVNLSMSGQMMISDSVIRLVVNELNALGAQAISINDQRKVATTEIRASGENIIINGLSFPRSEDFLIKAIVNPEQQEYVVSMLQSLNDTLAKQIESEQKVVMTINLEENVIINALSEDSISYKTDLLEPVLND